MDYHTLPYFNTMDYWNEGLFDEKPWTYETFLEYALKELQTISNYYDQEYKNVLCAHCTDVSIWPTMFHPIRVIFVEIEIGIGIREKRRQWKTILPIRNHQDLEQGVCKFLVAQCKSIRRFLKFGRTVTGGRIKIHDKETRKARKFCLV